MAWKSRLLFAIIYRCLTSKKVIELLEHTETTSRITKMTEVGSVYWALIPNPTYK